MLRKVLYSSDLDIQREIDRFSKIDKHRYEKLIKALKFLGEFDSKIEVFFDEEKSVNYAVDNNGSYYFFCDYFYYDSKYNYKDKYLLAKKVNDSKYDVYNFFNDCEHTRNVYTLDGNSVSFSIHGHVPNGYNFVYRSDSFKFNIFLWSKSDNDLDVNDFIADVLEMKPTTLMQIVDSFNQLFDVKDFKQVHYTTEKDDRVVSSLWFNDGNIEKLNIVEEAEDEEIHMYLKDGNIETESIRKVSIPVCTANNTIKNSYDSVCQLLKSKKS